jgi:hypothetical protein
VIAEHRRNPLGSLPGVPLTIIGIATIIAAAEQKRVSPDRAGRGAAKVRRSCRVGWWGWYDRGLHRGWSKHGQGHEHIVLLLRLMDIRSFRCDDKWHRTIRNPDAPSCIQNPMILKISVRA